MSLAAFKPSSGGLGSIERWLETYVKYRFWYVREIFVPRFVPRFYFWFQIKISIGQTPFERSGKVPDYAPLQLITPHWGISLLWQCLQTRASLSTSSRQSGHLTCVSGVGLDDLFPPLELPNQPTFPPHSVHSSLIWFLCPMMNQTGIQNPTVRMDRKKWSKWEVEGRTCRVRLPQFGQSNISWWVMRQLLVFFKQGGLWPNA